MKSHTPESLSSLRQVIKEYLATEGYRPTTNTDGEIIFNFEGKRCYLQTDAHDHDSVRIIIVNFRPVTDADDLARVTAASQEATGGTKVVKIFVMDNDTWCTAELLLPSPERFPEILGRTLSAVRAALRTFDKHLAN